MLSFMIHWLFLGAGVLLFLIGIIWVLQGLDRLGGSFMSGNLFWAWMGLIALVAGLSILYAGIRKWMRPPG